MFFSSRQTRSSWWKIFFEHSLNEWFTDETMWPKNRTRKMFHEWFDIEFHSMVWDMEEEPLAYEKWDDDGAYPQ